MNCSSTQSLGIQDLNPSFNVCESSPNDIEYGGVYINVLKDSLPQCDRAHDTTLSIGEALEKVRERGGEKFSDCNVYCAERYCGASHKEMVDKESEYMEACSSVNYIRSGALGMREEDLVDGKSCREAIVKTNKEANASCLTCIKEEVEPALLLVNGVIKEGATISMTSSSNGPPDWYARSGAWGNLPPFFHTDPVFSSKADKLESVYPSGSSGIETLSLTLDLRGTSFSEASSPRTKRVLAFWAAEDGGRGAEEAHIAYGNFGNRGISICEEDVCEMKVRKPGQYFAEKKLYPRHVHFTEWKGDRWSQDVGTINFPI